MQHPLLTAQSGCILLYVGDLIGMVFVKSQFLELSVLFCRNKVGLSMRTMEPSYLLSCVSENFISADTAGPHKIDF